MDPELLALLERLRARRSSTATPVQRRPLSPELGLFTQGEQNFFPDSGSPETRGILPALEAAFPTEEELAEARGRVGGEGTLLPMLLGGARRAVRETLFAPESRLPRPVGGDALNIGETLDALKSGIARQRQAEEAVRGEIPLARQFTSDVAEFGAALMLIPGAGKAFTAAARPAGRTAAGRILNRSVKEAGAFGGFEAARAGLAGENLGEVNRRVAGGLGAGAVIGGLSAGIGSAVATGRAAARATRSGGAVGGEARTGNKDILIGDIPLYLRGEPAGRAFQGEAVTLGEIPLAGTRGRAARYTNQATAVDKGDLSGAFVHGTTADNAQSIAREGIQPRVGEFIEQFHGEEILKPRVFLARGSDPKGALNAMEAGVARKVNKMQRDVTYDDVREHGALAVVLKEDAQAMSVRRASGRVAGVEPGDFQTVHPTPAARVLLGTEVADRWAAGGSGRVRDVLAPAVKLRGGRVVAGKPGEIIHADIFNRLSPKDAELAEDGISGFVTKKGRFLNREEAAELLLGERSQLDASVLSMTVEDAGALNPTHTGRAIRRLRETGFAEDIPGGGVEVRPGEFGELDTVTAIRRAQRIVGKERFEELARADIATRGGDAEHVKAPAFRMRDGRIIHGEPGEIHGDVFRRLTNKDKANIADENGFITSNDRFITRKEASDLADEVDLARAPRGEGLHSTDLADFRHADQGEEAAMRAGNFSDVGSRMRAVNTVITPDEQALLIRTRPEAAMAGTENAARQIVRQRDELTQGILARHNRPPERGGGGSTTHARTGAEPTEGFGVYTFKDREVVVDNMTQADLDNYIQKNRELLDQDDVFLGTWRNTETNKDVIDVSRVVGDRDEALRMARVARQDAIWDFANQKEIRVPQRGER